MGNPAVEECLFRFNSKTENNNKVIINEESQIYLAPKLASVDADVPHIFVGYVRMDWCIPAITVIIHIVFRPAGRQCH